LSETIEIVRAIGMCTVQDLGRPGQMHRGIPAGGALVPELLVAANRAARNPDGARGIEVCGQLVVRTSAGERVIASGERRVAYWSPRGGIAEPAALLCAERGRLLRAGDRLTVLGVPAVDPEPVAFAERTNIRVVPGPDLDAFVAGALERLLASEYKISPTSDRIGTRIIGPALPRDPRYRPRSRPMIAGALEVAMDGVPIVLGVEHPITGGYPIIAVVASTDLGAFHAIAPGKPVRFSV
jgi:allophanate hydrolase subunit 2